MLSSLTSMSMMRGLTTTSPVSSSNSVFGVANCLVRLDASDSANLSLGAANAVLYWKSSSTYASNIYMKTGVYTANGFPIWSSGTYPYIYFNNGGGSTVTTTSQGLASNNSLPGWTPHAEGTYYIVCTTTNDAVNSYHQVWRFTGSASTTYPSTWGLIHLSNQTGDPSYKAAYQQFQETSANTYWNTNLTYTATVPLNTRTIVCMTLGNNAGRYLYCNGTLWASNTATFTDLWGSTTKINYNNIIISAGNDSRCWTGYVNEVLWYGNYHDFNTRYSVQANLVSKWGITGMYQAPVTWTTFGSAAISTTYYLTNMSSTSSLALPGYTQPNRVAMTSFPASSRLSGSWTMEWFVYAPSTWNSLGVASGEAAVLTFGNTQPQLWIYLNYAYNGSTKASTFYVSNNWPNSWIFPGVSNTSMPIIGSWNHHALCYDSTNNQYQVFCNGTYHTGSSTLSTNTSPNIGTNITNYYFGCRAYSGGTYDLAANNLYVDGFRISSNVRYTGPYTVPTTYTVDANTIYINYFEGPNASTSMSNAEYYYI